MPEKITAETLLENQGEQLNWDGIRNPSQNKGWLSSLQTVAINRLIAHFLFGKPLDYDNMRESTKTAPDSAIPANTAHRDTRTYQRRDNLCKFEREWGRYGKQPLGDV